MNIRDMNDEQVRECLTQIRQMTNPLAPDDAVFVLIMGNPHNQMIYTLGNADPPNLIALLDSLSQATKRQLEEVN